MKDYSSFAIDLAYKAGKIMRKNFSLEMKKVFKELDGSPLTVSDITINTMVMEAVNKEFPTHSIIGEEESSKKKSGYAWVCDPIDGTIPFSSGVPISTFSLALTDHGVPILGVVYDPFMDRLFVGKKGEGATLNGKRINVSLSKKVESQIVYLGWWKYSLYDLLLVRKEVSKLGCKMMDFCSIIYGGSLVAVGEFAAIIFGDKFPWDAAAVKIIVEEAGGKCTDLSGNDQRYDRNINGLLAANESIHAQLLPIVKEFAVKQ